MVRIRQPSSRALGWVILALVALSLCLSLWTSYEQRQQAACQSELNARFLQALKTNTQVAEADRDNLATTLNDVAKALNGPDSREKTREILEQYQDRREEIDDGREDYPPLPKKVC